MTFSGSGKEGTECAHLDGNPRNNRLSNLRWVTSSENNYMKVAHGTMVQGSKNPCSKLLERDIPVIRTALARGDMKKDIAAMFGVDPVVIRRIERGEGWSHVV